MIIHRILLIIVAGLTLAVAATPSSAQRRSGDPARIAAAESYLDAYSRLDLAALESAYSEDASFVDQTSMSQPDPFIWIGRPAILEGLRRWKQSVVRLEYAIDQAFEASDRVVFVGTVDAVMRLPSGVAKMRYPIVTVVTLSEGRIVEHRDYTDYSAARRVASGQ